MDFLLFWVGGNALRHFREEFEKRSDISSADEIASWGREIFLATARKIFVTESLSFKNRVACDGGNGNPSSFTASLPCGMRKTDPAIVGESGSRNFLCDGTKNIRDRILINSKGTSRKRALLSRSENDALPS